jgi:hypothetical protein
MEIKKWYTSKTIWLAVLQGILGVVVATSSQIPTVGWLMLLKSAIDIMIRIVTEMPVSA